MKNYENKKTSAPNIFTLYNEDKKPVADIRGKKLAEAFAALPEVAQALYDMLDSYQLEASSENPALLKSRAVLLKIGHEIPTVY